MGRIYNPPRVDLILWDGTEEAFLEVRQKLNDNKTTCRGADLIVVIGQRPPDQVGVPDVHGNDPGPEVVLRGRIGEWVVFDPSTPMEAEILSQKQVDRRYPEAAAAARR